jgi:hypothetical protein
LPHKITLLFRKRVALTLLLGAGTTHAGTVLFSDLGSGGSVYNQFGANAISGSAAGPGGSVTQGDAFTPSSTAVLGQIDVALTFISGTNSVELTLNADNAGSPGAVLQTWTLTNLPTFGTCCTLETVTPNSPITLMSGTQYWLIASVVAANTSDGFNWNNTGATGPHAESDKGQPFVVSTATIGAFDVLSAVPEPSSFVLVAAGWAVCISRRSLDRRNRRS